MADRGTLGRFERHLVGNPLRAAVHRHLEAPWLRFLGGPVRGDALEIGCGNGAGTRAIVERLGADHVDAFDLDPAMVAAARAALADLGDRVTVREGDATALPVPGGAYAAVFETAVLHHVPRWRDAVAELYRVLQPGGTLYAEEVYDRFVHNRLARVLMRHPAHDRFDHRSLLAALQVAGFQVRVQLPVLGQIGWVVARKPASDRAGR